MRIDRVNLAATMAKRCMRGKELATLSGISVSSVAGIRNGRSCSAEMASKIASALNVPLSELLEKEK